MKYLPSNLKGMIVFIFAVLLVFAIFQPPAQAFTATNKNIQHCNLKFSDNQAEVLFKAYSMGDKYNLGATLAAQVTKEAFVGSRIIRSNVNTYRTQYMIDNNQSPEQSYGLLQTQQSTVKGMLKRENRLYKTNHPVGYWAMREEMDNIVRDDYKAIHYGLKYLIEIRNRIERKYSSSPSRTTWRLTVRKYNGAGKSADKYLAAIIRNVRYFSKCGYPPVKLDRIQKGIPDRWKNSIEEAALQPEIIVERNEMRINPPVAEQEKDYNAADVKFPDVAYSYRNTRQPTLNEKMALPHTFKYLDKMVIKLFPKIVLRNFEWHLIAIKLYTPGTHPPNVWILTEGFGNPDMSRHPQVLFNALAYQD